MYIIDFIHRDLEDYYMNSTDYNRDSSGQYVNVYKYLSTLTEPEKVIKSSDILDLLKNINQSNILEDAVNIYIDISKLTNSEINTTNNLKDIVYYIENELDSVILYQNRLSFSLVSYPSECISKEDSNTLRDYVMSMIVKYFPMFENYFTIDIIQGSYTYINAISKQKIISSRELPLPKIPTYDASIVKAFKKLWIQINTDSYDENSELIRYFDDLSFGITPSKIIMSYVNKSFDSLELNSEEYTYQTASIFGKNILLFNFIVTKYDISQLDDIDAGYTKSIVFVRDNILASTAKNNMMLIFESQLRRIKDMLSIIRTTLNRRI